MHFWLGQLEALESITQNEAAKRLFLRMAHLSEAERLEPLLERLESTLELDEDTRSSVVELARDRSFLVALADYVHRTQVLH